MKNITFVLGYYGSGKSEVSINLALNNKTKYLVDLDIVNPYFRSREVSKLLNKHNIRVISSDCKEANFLDMPYISKDAWLPLSDYHHKTIYDIGGSDVGAKVLRQFDINYEHTNIWFVINVFRPETSTVQKILEVMYAIEKSSGYKVTGLINNSNLLSKTTTNDIVYGQNIISEVSRISKIDFILTTYDKDIKIDHSKIKGKTMKLALHLTKNKI